MFEFVDILATIPTAILLAVVFSQIFILIFRRYKKIESGFTPSVTVIVPAHNEGKYIKTTVDAVLNNGYGGKLKVIVIDDGSDDETPDILKQYSKNKMVKLIRTNHIGKSKAMNKAIGMTDSEIVITIDGDTKVEKGSIKDLVAPFRDKNIAASTGVIKVGNLKKPLSWFQRLEYLNFAFFKMICDRINSVIAASGPLSAFRRNVLVKAGGFSSKTFLEDFDVALKLIKKGHKIRFVPTAVCYTFVPEKLLVLAKQRLRWTRGGAQIIKMHFDMFLKRKYKGPGMYSLPLLSYWYIHSVLIGLALVLQIIMGYYGFFFAKGIIFSFDVAKYFFYWFSIFGIINVVYEILLGNMTLTLLTMLNIILLTLTYAIFLISLRMFREPFTIKDVIAFIFMFPYWLILLFVQSLSNLEWYRKSGRNWWKK